MVSSEPPRAFPKSEADAAATDSEWVEQGASATSRQTEEPVVEHEVEKAPRSGAGRDLRAAIIVGVGLIALLVSSLLFYLPSFVLIVVVMISIGLWELSAAFVKKDIHIPLIPVLVGSTGMILSAYAAGSEALLVAFSLTCGGVFVWRIIDGSGPSAMRDSVAGIFATTYLPLMAGIMMLMVAAPDGGFRLLIFFAMPIASDTGGYIVGAIFGRHPMAPSVSPKKTWEGFAGSIVLAVSAGLVMGHYMFDGNWMFGLILALASVVTATIGDLSESLLKRDLGVKDMGKILPGHGGVLDRLDSLLLTAPVAHIIMTVLLPAV